MTSSQMMKGQGKYWSKNRSLLLGSIHQGFDTLNNSYGELIFV